MSKKKRLKKKSAKYLRKWKNSVDEMRSSIGDLLLYELFDNDAESDLFVKYMVEQNDKLDRETTHNILTGGTNKLNDNYVKEKERKCHNANELVFSIKKENRLRKKKDKLSDIPDYDLSLSRLLGDKRYTKKYLDVGKYRKELNKIAKIENAERKMAVKSGQNVTIEEIEKLYGDMDFDDEIEDHTHVFSYLAPI